MSRVLSQDVNDAITATQTNEVFLVLLTINHVELAAPITLVNNTQDIISTVTGSSVTYTAAGFKFTPNRNVEGTIESAKLTVCNVDRRIVAAVRSITSRPTASIYVIMASDPNTLVQGPWNFELSRTNYTATQVSGDLTYLAYLDETAGTVFFTASNFPGLFR